MARGRNSYPKVTVYCMCGWKGKRSTFMQSNPCPHCAGPLTQDPIRDANYRERMAVLKRKGGRAGKIASEGLRP